MEPEIHTGGIIIAKSIGNATTLEIGDVIVFNSQGQMENQKKIFVTHRIFKVTEDGFVTKGDACDRPDKGLVTPEKVVAKYCYGIPYFGYVLEFLKGFVHSKLGFLSLIIVPSSLLVFNELRRVKLICDVDQIMENLELYKK